jgi:hypothetical protein
LQEEQDLFKEHRDLLQEERGPLRSGSVLFARGAVYSRLQPPWPRCVGGWRVRYYFALRATILKRTRIWSSEW